MVRYQFRSKPRTTVSHVSRGSSKDFFVVSLTKESRPGKIHADLVGRVKPQSVEGYEYFLTIVDEATRYAETIPLHKKSDASRILIQFMVRFERQSGVELRALHTDEGSESLKAQKAFEELGVKVSQSTAYTPTCNGLAERTQGVLLSSARSCLKNSKLSLQYWAYALKHVTMGRKVIPHTVTRIAPHTALFGQAAEYVKHMRPFGCRTLILSVKKKQEKFESRLIEGIGIGHIDGVVYRALTADGTVLSKQSTTFLRNRISWKILD